MQKQKIVSVLIILILVIFIVPQIALAVWWNPFSWGVWNNIFHFKQQEQKQEKLIGGDKDAHGCLIAAGYSWCEVKQKCLRTWEEKCEAAINKTISDQNDCTLGAKCDNGSYCYYSVYNGQGPNGAVASIEGDKLCHKICKTDSDCLNGEKCTPKTIFKAEEGDAGGTEVNLCLKNIIK